MSSRFSPEPSHAWTEKSCAEAPALDSPSPGGTPAVSLRLEMLNAALCETDKLVGMLEDRINSILRPRSEPDKNGKNSEGSPVQLAADLEAFIQRILRINDQLRNVWERVEL